MWTAEDRSRLGRALRRLRDYQGLKQEDIATRGNMAVGTVHAIEHNTHKVNIEHLAQYAKAVGTTLQHLLPETRGMDTLLTDLVRKQTANAVLGAISSTIDAVVEELAQEILRDPAFREQMQQVIRTAFAQTLQDLNAPPKDDPDGQ